MSPHYFLTEASLATKNRFIVQRYFNCLTLPIYILCWGHRWSQTFFRQDSTLNFVIPTTHTCGCVCVLCLGRRTHSTWLNEIVFSSNCWTGSTSWHNIHHRLFFLFESILCAFYRVPPTKLSPWIYWLTDPSWYLSAAIRLEKPTISNPICGQWLTRM